jgi:hypothetical protein
VGELDGVLCGRLRVDDRGGETLGVASGRPAGCARCSVRVRRPTTRGAGAGDERRRLGEYGDDTQMAVCIAEVAATGSDLREPAALDQIATNILRWRSEGVTDVEPRPAGCSPRCRARRPTGSGWPCATLPGSCTRRPARARANGSLMRTGVVALACLDDPDAMAEAARAVSELTHFDALAGAGVCCGARPSGGRCSTERSPGFARDWT